MWICHRWMQEETTGRLHPPLCTPGRVDRRILRMAVMNCAAVSRTIAQQIQSITHHSVSALTIRRRLQQSGMSARRPLLRLSLAENHRRFRRQWCDERRTWGNGMERHCFLTNPVSACNITMVEFEIGDIMVRGY
ncbi:transposable element Tc1 transposase [Trichonephila clavipes]|nr:transposable element Tc1 transposase [Trichonephila clavipes]